jgi:hypothetical protein
LGLFLSNTCRDFAIWHIIVKNNLTCTKQVKFINNNIRWRGWDLNPRPEDYDAPALPAELPRQFLSGRIVLRSENFVN